MPWVFVNYFYTEDNTPLFHVLHPSSSVQIMDSDAFPVSIKELLFYGIDAMFISYRDQTLPSWLSSTLSIINMAAIICSLYYQGCIWIPQDFYPANLVAIVTIILSSVSSGWRYTSHRYNSAVFGDTVAAWCIGIKIFRDNDTEYGMDTSCTNNNCAYHSCGYEHSIDLEHNTQVDLYSILLPPDILFHSSGSVLPNSLLPLQVASTAVSVDW